MALARWQRTIVDEAGNILPNSEITVRREVTGAPLAVLYSDRDGVTSIGNPFNADAEGFAAFHVAGGAYQITATSGAVSRTWRYVGIGLGSESDLSAPSPLSADQLVVGDVGGNSIKTIEQQTPLPPNDDLNDVTHSGFHRVENLTANRPADFISVLTVMRSATRFGQLAFTTATANPKIFWRQVGSTISSWFRLLTTDDNSYRAVQRQSIATVGATLAVNMANGWHVSLSLGHNITTFTVSNPPPSGELGKITLDITSSGAFNISAWPGTTRWPGGTVPTLTGTGRDTIILTTTTRCAKASSAR